MGRVFRWTLTAMLLGIVAHASGSAAAGDWPRGTPPSQGVDPQGLLAMLDFIEREKPSLHSLMLVRHGHVVLDVAFYPFSKGDRHDIASCTKTVTATLVGIAMGQGKIKGVDAPMVELLSKRSFGNVDERKRSIRLEDLLTMRSGLYCLDDGWSQFQMFHSPHWVQFGMDLPATKQPGKEFQYFSVNSHLLSAIVRDATQQPPDEFAERVLFQPIGIENAGWPRDPQGLAHGWGDLRLTAEQMCRLGWLFLKRGEWEGKRVVPKEWIQSMTVRRVTPGGRHRALGYGYQIWIGDEGPIFRGRGGQRVYVLPRHDAVFVTQSGASRAQEPLLDRLLSEYIIPSLKKDAVTESSIVVELNAKIERAREPINSRAPAPLPAIALAVSKKRFEMSNNPYFSALTLDFQPTGGVKEGSEATITMSFPPIHRMSPITYRLGLDGQPRFSPGRHGEPAALHGEWKGNVFHLDFDELGNINHWAIAMTFNDGVVDVTMSEKTGLPPMRASGRSRSP